MGDRSPQHSYRTILSMMCHLFQFAAHVFSHELCSCGNIFSPLGFCIIARFMCRYNIAMLDKGALKEFHLLIFVRATKPTIANSRKERTCIIEIYVEMFLNGPFYILYLGN